MAIPYVSPRGLIGGYLATAVVLAAFAVVSVEALGMFHVLTAWAVRVSWTAATLAVVAIVWRRARISKPNWPGWIDAALALSILGIFAVIFLTAILSPPNSADAMAYHLPRVVYWIQQRSVRFFATPYLNQIMLQPFAEYLMLHTMLVSGGDRFVNLVQWSGCVTSAVAAAGIAGRFGAQRRGQLLAALFCVTIPNGILQASGAKNDYVVAAWLAAAVYFLLRPDETRFTPLLAGLSLGLAIGTKATAYLFAPCVIAVIVAARWRWWRGHARAAAWLVLAPLALNGPQFARNVNLSGSPLGFDSAQGNGKFRWRNEAVTPGVVASNVLRHATEQLGMRSERWNQGVYWLSVNIQHALGIDANDPRTTWPREDYRAPRNANHEADAGNPWQLLILLACFIACAWLRRDLLPYLFAIAGGFLLFCAYLKWQPFMARLLLALFVLGAPVVGVLAARLPAMLQIVLAIFLVNNTRHALFENWTRPLTGEHSLFRTSRDDNYFRDMAQWNARDADRRAVEDVLRTGCDVVGVDANEFQLEYPIEALILERNRRARFVHVNVSNASRKYARANDPIPCVTLKLHSDRVEICRNSP